MLKIILLFVLFIFTLFAFTACEKNGVEKTNTKSDDNQDDYIRVYVPGKKSSYKIFCGSWETVNIENEHLVIKEAIKSTLNYDMPVVSSIEDGNSTYIYVGPTPDDYYIGSSYDYLDPNHYEISVTSDDNYNYSIHILYNGKFAMLCAIDRFIKTFVKSDGIFVPKDLYITGECTEDDALIKSGIPALRDPCIFVADDGTYYAYGTGWVYYKNTSGHLDGDWMGPYDCVIRPNTVAGDIWAPEVHFYNGFYYMFTTYRSTTNNHRGCSIFKSDSLEGPFIEITPDHFTPSDWDSIDATFYIDKDGNPWSVFVHEWTSTDDGIGRMAAIRLTEDLSGIIGDPIELFKATDSSWHQNNITDGCWMYTTKDGTLKMIWSNWDRAGYCVGIAESSDGTLNGTWTHDLRVLFSRTSNGQYDGGHGMIFYDVDGQMYLSVHSPNEPVGDRMEMPVFMRIREINNTLIPDIWNEW